jgi:coatomer protein complex subunit gamma
MPQQFTDVLLPYVALLLPLQAARAICNLRDVTARELTPAITVLQLFLSSSKPVLRFAAVRTLNKVRCFVVLPTLQRVRPSHTRFAT